MKLQTPLTLLTLLLTTTVTATTATKPTIDVQGKADADTDANHKGKEKPKPKEKFCKIVGKKNGDAVKCFAEPQLMGRSVATVQSGAEYRLPCFVDEGSCLFNHWFVMFLFALFCVALVALGWGDEVNGLLMSVSLLFSEWYKLDWEKGSCYVSGYYTDCDKGMSVYFFLYYRGGRTRTDFLQTSMWSARQRRNIKSCVPGLDGGLSRCFPGRAMDIYARVPHCNTNSKFNIREIHHHDITSWLSTRSYIHT